ncbi:MAG: iron chelate uptake ABC transporter family permease subunit, partial [Planctomycetota bacterium]
QANSPSGSAGLTGLIYGQAATMQPGDVLLMAGVAAAAVAGALLLAKELTVVCFDDAFGRTEGLPVAPVDAFMMGLVVLVTIAGLQAVGLIMVVAMLIIPAVSARFWTERLWLMLVLAGVIGAASGYAGSVLSALMPRKPAGAVIVLSSGGFFVVSMLFAPSRGVIASTLRRVRVRLRIAGDHLLELAAEPHAQPAKKGLTSGATQGTYVDRSTIDRLAGQRGWSPIFGVAVRWSLRNAGFTKGVNAAGLELTERGLARGGRVRRNHLLWERYLVEQADIAPSHVDWTVDQVEHVLSPELVAQLESSLASTGEGHAP